MIAEGAVGAEVRVGLIGFGTIGTGVVKLLQRNRAQIRDRVNLECDMIGKYVVRATELAGLTLTPARPGDVTH